MIVMEGMMLVPPERGSIIGRALWKTRYIVLGTGSRLKTQNDLLQEKSGKAERRDKEGKKGVQSALLKPSLVDILQTREPQESHTLYITIYKAKGDWEFIAQTPVSAFKSCEIRPVQYRKQTSSLPTLLLETKPDSLSEKQRKRRSSRSGGLSSRDQWANILLLRSIPEERYSIYEWQAALKPLLTPEELTVEESPMSPLSPAFGNFSNPFAGQANRTSSVSNRPDFLRSASAANAYPHVPPRERPSAIISPSPSLRSRRSDLSSQASSMHPPIGFAHPQNYTTLPTDLPSPASTSGYEPQFIEGWTSAQGRSSALSSHTRGSNSIASAVAPIVPVGSTPPGPRETILDRAFQMRCIPGSERVGDEKEEKISSIARFEALMREVDERKQAKAIAKQPAQDAYNWDLDEESQESSEGELELEDDELEMSDQEVAIPPPAQRALEYISGRRTPLTASRPLSPAPRSPPIPFLNQQAMSSFHHGAYQSLSNPGLRPQTGTAITAQQQHHRRTQSRPSSLALPSRTVSSNNIPSLKDISSVSSPNSNLKITDPKEEQRNTTSPKRLSFSEFAKRLSGTSSLLLVQTNGSSSSHSGRASAEVSFDDERSGLRGGAENVSELRDKRCGWRGSVGVFGGEGGFM